VKENKLIKLRFCFPLYSCYEPFVHYKKAAIGYYAWLSQAIDSRVAPIIIFGDFRYSNYSSARMGKQTLHFSSHFENNQMTQKTAFENAAKIPNTSVWRFKLYVTFSF